MSSARHVADTSYGIWYDQKTDNHGRVMRDSAGHGIVTDLRIHFKDGEKEHIMKTSRASDDAHLHKLLLRDIFLKKKHIPGIRKFIEQNRENALRYMDGPAYVPEAGRPDNNYVHITSSPAALPDYGYLFSSGISNPGGPHHIVNEPTASQQQLTMNLPSTQDTHHFANVPLPDLELQSRLARIRRKESFDNHQAAPYHDPHYSQFSVSNRPVTAPCSIQ